MPPAPDSRRSRLRRALAPVRGLSAAGRAVRAAGRVAGTVAGSVARVRRPGDAMLALHEPLRDAVDVVASRLLALDADASILAMYVERVTAGRDVSETMGTVLRRNLLLDGTFMAIVEPLVATGELPDALDAATLGRASDTMTRLLAELAGVDADVDDPLAAVADASDVPLDGVLRHLRGESSAEDRTRFVALSYVLFLEAWLLRATVDRIGAIARLDAPAPPAALEDPGDAS